MELVLWSETELARNAILISIGLSAVQSNDGGKNQKRTGCGFELSVA